MIVLDASVLIDVLTRDDDRGRAARKAAMGDPHWLAPAHLAVEVASGIRGRLLGGKIDQARADDAIAVLADLEIELAPWGRLLPRMWELRGNLTSYDAAYVALAEAEGCPLLTLDVRLRDAPGVRCEVRVV